MEFLEWEAAVAAGASMDELEHLHDRPTYFRAKLIAWHEMHNLVSMHQDAASRSKMKGGK